MAASAWTITNHAKLNTINGDWDLNADTFICALVTSSATLSATTEAWSSISANEVSGSGYSSVNLGALTVTESTGTVTVDDPTDPAYTASGGSIVARWAVIYQSGGTGDVLCYCLLDNTPADVTVTDGNTLTITLNASGIISIT